VLLNLVESEIKMREKPIVGQEVFSLNVGNSARNSGQVLTPYVVVKVGRKYFTAKPTGNDGSWCESQYHLDSWAEKTDYSADSVIYASRQEWYDEVESSTLCDLIYKSFSYGNNVKNLSIGDIRHIAEILGIEKVAIERTMLT